MAEDSTQHLLIRTSEIISMDPKLGNLKGNDVRVEGGRITEIGPLLNSRGATVIAEPSMVALPGMVDVHRHTWQSSVRHSAVGWSLDEYQQNVQGNVGERLEPEDARVGNLLGALSALDAGITTIRDESHAQNSPAHTDALIAGLRDSGIRAAFAYGWPSTDAMAWLWDSSRVLPDDIYRVRSQILFDDNALVTLNALLRGPEMSSLDVTKQDIARARDLDIAMSMHVGIGELGLKYHGIRVLGECDLIGPDMTFVHCCTSDDDELRMIAAGGAHACVTPAVESTMPGIGVPATGRLLAQGIRPSIGVDIEVGTPGDLFSAMRNLIAAERLRETVTGAESSVELTAKDVLEFATVRGAAALQLEDRIGSLTVGKAADIVLIDMSAPNLVPGADPVASIVANAHPGNVDTVIVGGVIRKRHGKLTYPHLEDVADAARRSRRRLLG